MSKYSTLSPVIKSTLAEWYRDNRPDMSSLEILADINNSTPAEIFEKYCEWNGLINMSTELFNVVADLVKESNNG